MTSPLYDVIILSVGCLTHACYLSQVWNICWNHNRNDRL